MESANAIAGNPLVVLSKQQVLDCVLAPFYLSDGCNGGMLDDVFHYAKQVGLTMEKTYPYKGKVCHLIDNDNHRIIIINDRSKVNAIKYWANGANGFIVIIIFHSIPAMK